LWHLLPWWWPDGTIDAPQARLRGAASCVCDRGRAAIAPALFVAPHRPPRQRGTKEPGREADAHAHAHEDAHEHEHEHEHEAKSRSREEPSPP
jgi:hypothetical protein